MEILKNIEKEEVYDKEVNFMNQKELRDSQKGRHRIREGLDIHADHRLRGTEIIKVTKFVEGLDGGLKPVVSFLKGDRPSHGERG